ncbi:hypothetical protein [Candidatus Accumulibacter sp. ACC007]|uniref:hypothetical protein n=1 Tax=Candidatus Accumulibacter sp. ACC007 TaxID=2823333 RepID=UPI0025BB4CCF|nr:hypothetical protein [Candidatus Accumulibacter sp. ACC007]
MRLIQVPNRPRSLFRAGPGQTTGPAPGRPPCHGDAVATVLTLFAVLMLLTLEWLGGRAERMRSGG